MLYIEQFVYTNNLQRAHPVERVSFAVISLLICLVTEKISLQLLILAVMLGLLVFVAKIPARIIGRLITIPLGFLLIGILPILVSINSHPAHMLAHVNLGSLYVGITRNTMNLAVTTFITSFSSVCCLYFLALTTPVVQFLYVLQLLRVPKIIIELMTITYRFISVFLETFIEIYTAQSSRWGYRNFRRSISSFGILFANLWGHAFFKAQALFTGLLSRGYEQELKVLNPRYGFCWSTIVLFTVVEALFITIAVI